MKHSTLLEKAKKHLLTSSMQPHDDTHMIHICNAVKVASGGKPGGAQLEGAVTSEARDVILHIGNLLEGSDTYDNWLWYKRDISRDETMYDSGAFEKMQLSRLAWIDDMITYWKAKGM
jgi:hypothetical protein